MDSEARHRFVLNHLEEFGLNSGSMKFIDKIITYHKALSLLGGSTEDMEGLFEFLCEFIKKHKKLEYGHKILLNYYVDCDAELVCDSIDDYITTL